jgi:hypothetical protein
MANRSLHLRAPLSLAATALILAALPGAARAGEQEWVVAPSLAYSAVRDHRFDGPRHGVALLLDVDYGLTDSWSLRVTARWAGHGASVTGDAAMLHETGASFGALYTFDVLKIVPFVSLTAGFSCLALSALGRPGDVAGDPRWNADLTLGVGLDYLVKRDFSVGFEIRYHLLVPDVQDVPWMITLGLRLAWRRQ